MRRNQHGILGPGGRISRHLPEIGPLERTSVAICDRWWPGERASVVIYDGFWPRERLSAAAAFYVSQGTQKSRGYDSGVVTGRFSAGGVARPATFRPCKEESVTSGTMEQRYCIGIGTENDELRRACRVQKSHLGSLLAPEGAGGHPW